ncbi:hypothetical protein PRUPE_1G300900 [Prunus persica]|uniref:F-box domain-containing protein n=2 Tax=Prunus persica TaxID=3760 RepID=A0A251R5C3_PRUPE|nr:hypothetical protein PRUPE_1G300900 [Prunus persica]
MEAYHDHAIPELPTEIIFTHILPRLPPKDLMMRCTCVCKSWSSFIRSSSFVAAFRNFCGNDNNKSTTNFLFQKYHRFLSSKIEKQGNVSTPAVGICEVFEYCLSYDGKIQELGRYYPDVQSVHGLICGSSSCQPEFFILNPSTREYIELPHAKERPVNHYAHHAYHFGFSPLANEYKVLQVLSFRLDQGDKWDLAFNTFTLGRDSWWRPLQVDHGDLPFDALAYASDSRGKRSTASVCLNGAVYWIYEEQKMLVAFDVKEETFKALPLPEDYDQVFANYYADQDYEQYSGIDANDYCCPTMVKVGGCVGVFADMSWKHDKIVLWILKDYQNIVWVKETISLASEREYLGYRRCIEALGTIHTGEFALVHYFIGFSPGYDDGPPELRLYDMKSKQYRVIDFAFPDYQQNRVYPFPIKLINIYDDSIVPLK